MDDLERMRLILEIIVEANKLLGIINRTHLQKLVYLLQEIKSVPLGYNFKMSYYGPHSEALWGTLCGMRDLGIIDIKFCPQPFKYTVSESKSVELKKFQKVVSVSSLDEGIAKYRKSYKDLIQLISQHQRGGTWCLELLGTTHFVHKMLALYKWQPSDKEIVSAVQDLKPHFTAENIERALATLRKDSLLNDP